MVREAVEQRGGHLGIAENGRPFAEGEIGRDDDRGALIEATDQVEQQLAARLRERQIAQLVEDDEVEAGEIVGKPTLGGNLAFGMAYYCVISETQTVAKAIRTISTDFHATLALSDRGSPVPGGCPRGPQIGSASDDRRSFRCPLPRQNRKVLARLVESGGFACSGLIATGDNIDIKGGG